MDIQAKLELPAIRRRSINGFPIKAKHVISDEVKDAIAGLVIKGASFLSIDGNKITVRINGQVVIINVDAG